MDIALMAPFMAVIPLIPISICSFSSQRDANQWLAMENLALMKIMKMYFKFPIEILFENGGFSSWPW